MIKGKDVDALNRLKLVTEQRKVNTFEKDQNTKYLKQNAALKAKLDFIEQKYDYSSQAKQLSIADFKEIISSNTSVNNTLGGFTGKLENVQKDI